MDAVVLRCPLFSLPAAEMTDVRVLETLLFVLMQKNIEALRAGLCPSWDVSGVRWADGGDLLDLPWAPTVYRERKAACGPISAYAAASLRFTGQDPAAVPAVKYRRAAFASRPMHAFVRLSNGAIYDPSIERGMPAGA